MIYRTIKDKDHQYIRLNISAANDARLSYKAIGIHTYIMAKPDGWEARENDMVERHPDGISAVRSGVKELIACGYMVRVRVINTQGKVVDWRIDTYEAPELNPHYHPGESIPPHIDEPHLDSPDVGILNMAHPHLEKPQVDYPQVENVNVDKIGCETKPDCDFPDMEKPQVDYPQVENRNCSNNRNIVITDVSYDPDPVAIATAAVPPPLPLAKQFSVFHDELKSSKNRAEVLRRAYICLYGESDAPTHGRLGDFAAAIGSWGMALKALWESTSRPPVGDVLSYLERSHKGQRHDKRNGRVPVDDGERRASYHLPAMTNGEASSFQPAAPSSLSVSAPPPPSPPKDSASFSPTPVHVGGFPPPPYPTSRNPWSLCLQELEPSLPAHAREWLAGSELVTTDAAIGNDGKPIPTYQIIIDPCHAAGLQWLQTRVLSNIRHRLGSILGHPILLEIVIAAEKEPA